jgi:hypothetical protein
MEMYSDLYRDVARKYRCRADALPDGQEKEAFLRIATAYEHAATEMQAYPEAA